MVTVNLLTMSLFTYANARPAALQPVNHNPQIKCKINSAKKVRTVSLCSKVTSAEHHLVQKHSMFVCQVLSVEINGSF